MCDQPPEGGGPPKLANLITFKTTEDPQVVWSLGDVKVSAIRSTHIPGHSSYRVETPAGSVVIGGDATNDVLTQPRAHSASDQVELLAKGVDVIVHSTMHPIMGPDRDSGMPSEVFNRQSSTTDLGAMAQRVNAKHLVLTHLGPSIGAAFQGAYKVPGGALTAADSGRLPRRADSPATSSWALIWRACEFPGSEQGELRDPAVCFRGPRDHRVSALVARMLRKMETSNERCPHAR